jgi:hypothetical protein
VELMKKEKDEMNKPPANREKIKDSIPRGLSKREATVPYRWRGSRHRSLYKYADGGDSYLLSLPSWTSPQT